MYLNKHFAGLKNVNVKYFWVNLNFESRISIAINT